MSSEIALPSTSFENIINKIKSDLGNLLTDEDLKKIVATAVQKIFFDPPTDKYDRPTDLSEFLKLLKPILEKQVRDQILKWLEENKTMFEEAVKAKIPNTFSSLLIDALNNRFRGSFEAFASSILETIKRGY